MRSRRRQRPPREPWGSRALRRRARRAAARPRGRHPRRRPARTAAGSPPASAPARSTWCRSWARRPALRLAWEQSGLPLLVRSLAPDVVHSPHYTLPLVSTIGRRPRNVVTLHDATFFSDPELRVGVKARFFRGWTSVSVGWPTRSSLRARRPGTRSPPTPTLTARASPSCPRRRPRPLPPPTPAEVDELRQWLGLEADQPYVAFLGTSSRARTCPRSSGLRSGRPRDDVAPVLVLAGGKGLGRRCRAGRRGLAGDAESYGRDSSPTAWSRHCSAAPRSSRTPPTGRASASLCSRRWRAGQRSSPPTASPSPRSAATQFGMRAARTRGPRRRPGRPARRPGGASPARGGGAGSVGAVHLGRHRSRPSRGVRVGARP